MSKAIKKLYTDKGLTPPKGKGIHTYKFHDIASSVMQKKKQGKSKVKEPYALAMSMLGRNKAVNPSHWQTAVNRSK